MIRCLSLPLRAVHALGGKQLRQNATCGGVLRCIWLLVTDCFAIVPFSLHPHCLLLAAAGVERQQARGGGAGCGCFQLSFPRGACPSGEQSVQAGPVNTTGTSASRTPPHHTTPHNTVTQGLCLYLTATVASFPGHMTYPAVENCTQCRGEFLFHICRPL